MSPQPQVPAVVLPVNNSQHLPYLSTLVKRNLDFTTMIWGWQRNAKRMLAPSQLLRQQTSAIPFLFSQTEQEAKRVTHVAVCGLIVHYSDPEYADIASWLRSRRVERFAGLADSEWSDDVQTFYVVSATSRVGSSIPYESLTLVNRPRPLSSAKKRGYAMVFLPEALANWFVEARNQWRVQACDLPLQR